MEKTQIKKNTFSNLNCAICYLKKNNTPIILEEIKKIYNPIAGQIYCLKNEIFDYYGKNVRKYGKTKDLKLRLSAYTTSYIKKSEYEIFSDILSDCDFAEKILFYELRKYRIENQREFFNCDINFAKKIFSKINELFKSFNNNLDNIINYFLDNFIVINKKKLSKKKLVLTNNELLENIKAHIYDINCITKLDSIIYLEKLFNINTFEIEKIIVDNDNIINIKKDLQNNINKIILLFDNESKQRRLTRLIAKINKLDNTNKIQKFVADCYNSFGNIIKIKIIRKSVRINNAIRKIQNYFFEINF